jgi:hypothetical protein
VTIKKKYSLENGLREVAGFVLLIARHSIAPRKGEEETEGYMNSVVGWFCLIMIMLFAAGFWFAYLVKLVLNDEVVQEKRRRRNRVRELERRREEDQAMKRRRRRR